MIDYSGFAHPKPAPPQERVRRRRVDLKQRDDAEKAEVRRRSGGQCEVRDPRGIRCRRAAWQNHHLKRGSGIRNRGDSLLAIWRLDTCEPCHDAITGGRLVPVDPLADARHIRYVRRTFKRAARAAKG